MGDRVRNRLMRVGNSPGRAVLLAAAALLISLPVRAQRVPERRLEKPIDFSTSQDDNLFSLVRSQDYIHEWDQALTELEAGAHGPAVERLHRLLQIEKAGVVPVSPGRFLGLHLAVVTTMANLSPAAEQAYEATVRREAGGLLDHPLWELGFDQLTQLAERFPTASIGRQARLHLGDLAFEKGDGITAIRHYRRALDATRIGSDDERRTAARLECAQALIDPRTARDRAAKKRLFEGAEDVLTTLPPSTDPTWYPAIGGGVDGRTPMSPPAGKPQAQRTEDVYAAGFGQREIGQFAMFPVGDLDVIFVNTGREMIAFDPLRKTRAWESPTPMREHDTGDRDPEQINHDMVLACACGGDLVVGALQVPDKSQNVDFQQSFRIISKIPQRRLFAFSRRTGKLVWSHFDEMDGSRTRFFRGHDACGPPVIVGDTVYAPIHDRSGAIAFAVAAYELQTGKPKWRQLVCSSQQDVNMFGNARMEFAASPISITGGVIYGATNLGVTYALDAPSGRVRWITAYEVVRMPRAMLHNQADRNIYFANNAPVVAEGVVCFTPLDSAFVLGIDAETGRLLWRVPAEARVAGVDNSVAWLAGSIDDEFILAGKGAVAVRARPDALTSPQPQVRQLVRPEQLTERGDDLLQPRPAVTGDHVWFARVGRILGFDRTGAPVPRDRQIESRNLLPGNLLLIDGIVVSLRQRALDILFDPSALQQRVEKQLEQTPEDPAVILRLASLLAALPEDTAPPAVAPPDPRPPGNAPPAPPQPSLAERILALYRRGLEACQKAGMAKNHPVRQALQRELFQRARASATKAIERGDPHVLELLIEAREAAPDTSSWIEMQSLVLARCKANPERMRTELDRLEQTAGDANFPPGDEVPVRAWLLWQRALLAESTPAAAVLLWQQLLEQFGQVPLSDGAAASVAQAAIERLVAAHGAAIYAPIAARADGAAAAAGDNMQALQDVGLRFPNSSAAKKTRTQLLDLSVQKGDLVVACDVLAQSLRTGAAAPGILRRVAVAALARGNLGLARAMATRLSAYADETSDWPADNGAPYRTALAALLQQLATASSQAPLGVPRDEIARIAPRTPRELLQLVSVLRPDGFEALRDEPLFVKTHNELLAYDVQAAGDRKPILFTLPTEYLEDPVGIVVCGDTVVVPDLERVFAVNYRTGAVRWELPNQKRRILDCLGVQDGVVHLFAKANVQDGNSELIGIEPLSGSILFTRTVPANYLRPKPVPGQLVVMEIDPNGGANIHRFDPVTGRTERTTPIAASVLQAHLHLEPDSLALDLYPQGICADGERVFLPVDNAQSSDTPSLVAIDATGQVAWQWRGHAGNKLLMTASRGDRIVVVEGGEKPGQVVLLSGKDGSVLRAIELGANISILNWESSRLANESPAIIAFCDLADGRSRLRRLVCFAVDDGSPTFEVPLGPEDGQVEPRALFGADFVTFGVRPMLPNEPFRLYSLRLSDRSGALSDGKRFRQPDRALGRTHGLGAAGPYTVVGGSHSLLVLGDKAPKK
ncbi:MAG TPA: PQQ-binding-like beta-propeller repeat protein [Planctomycetota bacterium]|nr:PQQ-binding-like beta-propeller repeat protein [Planctomycetota bacterium]